MNMSGGWSTFTPGLKAEEQAALVDEAAKLMSTGLSFNELVDVDSLTPRARLLVTQAADRLRIAVPQDRLMSIAEIVVGRVGGLGFFLPLFNRNDLSEIVVIPDGSLWVLKKGAHDFEKVRDNLDVQEVGRATEALLRPIGRAVNEATPSVDAKLPRIESLTGLRGGARIKILHPVIAPGKSSYPSINIRLFEPRPVRPEQLVAWNVAPEAVIQGMLEDVSKTARILVIGGTASGKTTLLSAISNGIPKSARIVKIEDPEEIWIDHPHVVTIEARPVAPGSSVLPYTIKDGVDDAMRMSPRWLIVGEVRRGDAALALFRAQMSDHPGLSTFHADGPEKTVHRMSVIMFTDAGVRIEAAKEIFAQAVDLVIQVGWLEGKRAILGVWEVDKDLKGGDVRFRTLYQPGDATLKPMSVR